MLCWNITDLSLVLQFKINLLLNQLHGHLFSTFSKPTKEVSHFESINGLGLFQELKKIELHLEQELQVKKTLESSAKMIRREEMVSLMPHCRKSLENKSVRIYLPGM